MKQAVVKRTVEQYQVFEHKLERQEAVDLYNQLGIVLNLPRIDYSRCDERYSHDPHMSGSRAKGFRYCPGRSQDAT